MCWVVLGSYVTTKYLYRCLQTNETCRTHSLVVLDTQEPINEGAIWLQDILGECDCVTPSSPTRLYGFVLLFDNPIFEELPKSNL